MPSHPLLAPINPATSSKHFFLPTPAERARTFHPQNALGVFAEVTLLSTGVGTLVSCVQNALENHNKGAMGVFTRTGGTIAFFAAMGGSFALTQAVTANIRESDDALNGAAGGCAAGFVAGIRAGSLPMAVGTCAFLGTVIGTFKAAGDSLQGTNNMRLSRPEREEKRLEFFKKKRRTILDLDRELAEGATAGAPA